MKSRVIKCCFLVFNSYFVLTCYGLDQSTPQSLSMSPFFKAEHSSAKDHLTNPWRLFCRDRIFPPKNIARAYFHRKPFDIQVCEATQTVTVNIEGEKLEATLKLTPARIVCQLKNVIDRRKEAVLVVGEAQSKHFDLYANCYIQGGVQQCALFPNNKIENRAIVKAMSQNKKTSVRISDLRFSNPITFNFSLNGFQVMHEVVEKSYRDMKAVLSDYNSEDFVIG